MDRIFARKCTAKIIKYKTSQEFINKNYSQEIINNRKRMISIGLFYNSNLMAVAQFCSPRTSKENRKYTTELLRLCFKKDFRIIGGASKLIKFYIKSYNPPDFFTYQPATGENTDVYLKCGLSFVKQENIKKFLIAPNKTFETADRKNKEIFTISIAEKLGPNILIGSDLEDSKGVKTNTQLFTKDLGWHVEEFSGDKIFEWINPNYTFYTYKITAKGSDKYYFGVSHIKKNNASVEDCLNDGYFGSGNPKNKNNKFQKWKEENKRSLKKTIIKRFNRKSEAYEHEAKIIGNLWKTDEKCLNSREGGCNIGIAFYRAVPFITENCSIHGESLHRNGKCCKCVSLSGVDLKNCDVHGLTKHRGSTCYKCLNLDLIEEDFCEKHGKTKFKSGLCSKCANENNTKIKKCPIHGKTIFLGNTCLKCANNNSISEKFCEKHGITKHRGDSCAKCNVEGSYNPGFCEIHGKGKFIGDKCVSCINESSVSMKECTVHGLVKHHGSNCYSCIAENNVSFKICEIHGETKFIGDKCFSCRRSNLEKKICKIHGESFHTKNGCLKCVREESNYKKKICIMCQEEFVPLNGRQKVCKKDHYIPCPGCGTEMLYHSKKKTCSISCGLKYRNSINREASSKIS